MNGSAGGGAGGGGLNAETGALHPLPLTRWAVDVVVLAADDVDGCFFDSPRATAALAFEVRTESQPSSGLSAKMSRSTGGNYHDNARWFAL